MTALTMLASLFRPALPGSRVMKAGVGLIAAACVAALPHGAYAQPEYPPSPKVVHVSPTPGVTVGDGRGLDEVVIRFNENVSIPGNAVRVWAVRRGEIVGFQKSYDPVTFTLRVTFQPEILDDRVSIVLDYSIINTAGTPLDGETASPRAVTFPTGDGIPGGQAVFEFGSLLADWNHTGNVNSQDFFDFISCFFDPACEAEFNRDHFESSQDAFDFLAAFFRNDGSFLAPTDGVAPVVTGITPDSNVRLDAPLPFMTIAFSEPIAPVRMNGRTLLLVGRDGTLYPASTVVVAGDARSATFSFSPPLSRCDRYTINISNAVADPSGEPLIRDITGPVITGLVPPPVPTLNAFTPATREDTITLSGFAPQSAIVEFAGPGGIFTTNVNPTTGAFSRVVTLARDRANLIYVAGISPCNIRGGPATAMVTMDATPPNLFIDAPLDGAEIEAASTDVAGRVSDALSGARDITVTVNGLPATVHEGIGTNGTFFRGGLLLPPDSATTITVVATDALMNSITRQIMVSRVTIPIDAPMMTLVLGNSQTGFVNSPLPVRLRVRVTRDSQPIVNKVVTFDVTRSDGKLSTLPGPQSGSRMVQVLTDAQGRADVFWTLGSEAGVGNNRVCATSRDIAGTIVFCASATHATPDQINIGSGNNQRAEVNTPVAMPLRAWVSDSCNGIEGQNVTFTVLQGGGMVRNLVTGATASSVTVPSLSTGHAEVGFILGPQQGNQVVEANFAGNPNGAATFIAYALRRDPLSPGSLSGSLFDNASQPLAGAGVRLLVNGQLVGSTQTDEQGQFRIGNVSVGGAGDVFIDSESIYAKGGEPIPEGMRFPAMHYEVPIIADAPNELMMPVLLPPLLTVNDFIYSGTQTEDLALTCQGIEGLRFIVRAGTVIRLHDGTLIGPANPGQITLSINQVHHDNVPMPMPDGVAPPFAWTFQPAGAHFDPPVQVEYPNMSGLAPGSIANFLSFDHAINMFSIVASGTVSEDGLVIRSDPGVGIPVSGWGCNCPPYAVTGMCMRRCDKDCLLPPCTACPAALTIDPVTDPDALVLENNPITWTSVDSTVQSNLTTLRTAYDSFVTLVHARDPNVTIRPTSVYRPVSYQAHLYNVKQAYIASQMLPMQCQQACASQLQRIMAECAHHGVCENPVAPPGQSAHSRGNAVDISKNISPLTCSDIVALAGQAGLSVRVEPNAYHLNTEGDVVGCTRGEGGHEEAGDGPDPEIGAWSITVGGQAVTAQFETDFTIANISIPDRFGEGGPGTPPDFVGDEPVRVIASARIAGTVYYAFGDPFRITRGLSFNVPQLTITTTPPAIAQSIRIDAQNAVIQPGQTTRVQVFGTLADGSTRDFTRRQDWTIYRTSNPAIATIEQDGDDSDGIPDGTVIAHAVGTVSITASNDAATAVRRIFVTESARHTTVDGFVYDATNNPVSGATVSADVVGGSVMTGPNGRFTLPVTYLPDDALRLRITAVAEVDGLTRIAVAFDLEPINNGMTDAGILVLRPLCNPEWAAGFDAAGFNGSVLSMLNVAGSSGAIQAGVYAAGDFTVVGGAGAAPLNRVAFWDGASWRALGAGFNNTVHTLALLPGPSGPTLIAAGDFTMSGPTAVNRIAQWDGSMWTPLGSGMNDTVTSLAVVNAANGPQLYAGGWFTTAGGIPASRVAHWTGSAWEALGAGLNRAVLAMASYDSGTGPQLFVGGDFTFAGGSPANRLARWNGAAWAPIGIGANGVIRAMASFADGPGPALYVAGDFTSINGTSASRVARYNGLIFTPLGAGLDSTVRSLTARVAPEGFTLYAAGDFGQAGTTPAARIAAWNGSAWSALGSGVNSTARAAAVVSSFGGPVLFVGGDFTQAGNGPAGRAAKFATSTGWSGFGNGLNGPANAFAVLPTGASNSSLIVGGAFNSAGSVFVNNLATWDGTTWSDLGGGVNDAVLACTSRMEVGGTALYVGGVFDRAGPSPGIPVNLIGRYHNNAWSSLGGGVNAPVRALHFFDDGTGPALFAGGDFTNAGGPTGASAGRIAKWTGTQWQPLASGLNGRVLAMATFDTDHSMPLPPSLIVAGEFTTAGGIAAQRIARWNGMAWINIGNFNGTVRALAVFGKGAGEELYAAGDFTMVGTMPVNRIARWDGSAWTALDNGIGDGVVNSLAIFNDGLAPTLYAAGTFTVVDTVPQRNRIAQWNGNDWISLETGINNAVQSLIAFDQDGPGGEFPSLYAGGAFSAAGNFGAGGVARWSRPLLCGNFLIQPNPGTPSDIPGRLADVPAPRPDGPTGKTGGTAGVPWRISSIRATSGTVPSVQMPREFPSRVHSPATSGDYRLVKDGFGHPRALWRSSEGTWLDIGTLGGSFTTVTGANDSGQLTGFSQTADGEIHAIHYVPSTPECPARLEDLGAIRGKNSYGLAINARGVVVGQAGGDLASVPEGDPVALLSPPGSPMIDLNTILPDGSEWTLQSADSITDQLGVSGTGLLSGVPARFDLTLQSLSAMPKTACCPADFDHDNLLTSGDLHMFLSAFFTSSATADLSADLVVNADDFFLFMKRYLAGCP